MGFPMGKFKYLINISNHPSSRWSQSQLQSALAFAEEIIDVPFPLVDPSAREKEIHQMASEIFTKHILSLPKWKDSVVMIQGEFSLCYALFMLCKSNALPIAIPTTSRQVREKVLADGSVIKQATFKFVRWRIL